MPVLAARQREIDAERKGGRRVIALRPHHMVSLAVIVWVAPALMLPAVVAPATMIPAVLVIPPVLPAMPLPVVLPPGLLPPLLLTLAVPAALRLITRISQRGAAECREAEANRECGSGGADHGFVATHGLVLLQP